MKEARYLIRVSHSDVYPPAARAHLLSEARRLAGPLHGKAINLRVSPLAIEFDLFCDADASVDPFLSAFGTIGRVITCKRLGLPPGPVDAQTIVDEARKLFNEHRFWEVHEVLEGLWKELKGSEKDLVQGLILAAAALVHAQKDESAVLWTLLADALARLEGQPELYYGWNVGKFRDHFAHALAEKKLEFPTV